MICLSSHKLSFLLGTVIAVIIMTAGCLVTPVSAGVLSNDDVAATPEAVPEQKGAEPLAASPPSSEEEGSAAAKIKKTDTKAIPNYFARVNLQSLTKLAWALGAYDPTDMDSIDRYLKINECHLYHKFFFNDFEWNKVRLATSAYLKEYRQNVPRFYEFVQPVKLQRYDFRLQGFVLEDVNNYISLNNIQLAYGTTDYNECNDSFKATDRFPIAGVLKIKSPFSLPFMRVPPEVAQEYTNLLVKNNVDIEHNGRPAYLRFRMGVSNYTGIAIIDREPFFFFKGRLTSVELFADKDLTLPMYAQYF
jgi:hypothetical protein